MSDLEKRKLLLARDIHRLKKELHEMERQVFWSPQLAILRTTTDISVASYVTTDFNIRSN